MHILLQHAIRYAEMGWSVIPLHFPIFQNGKPPVCSCGNPNCASIGKHPALKNGVKGATKDKKIIQKWWDKGNWNIGIAAGASNIIIIDVDPRNGGIETLKSICAYAPIPKTLTAQTGGGGKHYIFLSNIDQKLPKTLGPGIDVQQGNRYIVAPPSLHKSGNNYYWLNSSAPITPEWILSVNERILQTPKFPKNQPDTHIPTEQKRAFAEGCLVEATEKVRQAKPGERQSTLNKEAYGMGGFIARGLLDEQEVTAKLLSAAPISQGVFGIADFTFKEAEKTIIRGLQDGKEAPRSVGFLQPAVTHNALPSADGSSIEWRDTLWPTDLMEPGNDWTELGLARRSIKILTEKYQSDVIFDRDTLWTYHFEQHRWIEIPQHHQTLATIWHGARRDKKKPLNITAAKLTNIEKLIRVESHQPGFFNTRTEGICFKNGRYLNGKLYPLTPEDHNTFIIPHTYNPEADTSKWYKWFSYFWPDKNIQKIILEFIGACLFGVVTNYERALMLLGGGDNGKSTLLHMIRALFQPQAVISINPQNFSNEYYRAKLIKAQLNIVTELKYEELKDTETIKAIISGEEISAREPMGKVFFFEPKMGNIFAGNKLPKANDLTHGFRKRFLLIPCDVTIHQNNIIPDYHLYLENNAMDGFIKELVKNAEALIKQKKYTESYKVDEAKRTWFKDSDQIEQFVDEAILVDNEKDKKKNGIKTGIQAIYNHYRAWASITGHKIMSKRSMVQRLRNLGIRETRTKNQRYFYLQIKNLSNIS